MSRTAEKNYKIPYDYKKEKDIKCIFFFKETLCDKDIGKIKIEIYNLPVLYYNSEKIFFLSNKKFENFFRFNSSACGMDNYNKNYNLFWIRTNNIFSYLETFSHFSSMRYYIKDSCSFMNFFTTSFYYSTISGFNIDLSQELNILYYYAFDDILYFYTEEETKNQDKLQKTKFIENILQTEKDEKEQEKIKRQNILKEKEQKASTLQSDICTLNYKIFNKEKELKELEKMIF